MFLLEPLGLRVSVGTPMLASVLIRLLRQVDKMP
jgi:hypothetical protein